MLPPRSPAPPRPNTPSPPSPPYPPWATPTLPPLAPHPPPLLRGPTPSGRALSPTHPPYTERPHVGGEVRDGSAGWGPLATGSGKPHTDSPPRRPPAATGATHPTAAAAVAGKWGGGADGGCGGEPNPRFPVSRYNHNLKHYFRYVYIYAERTNIYRQLQQYGDNRAWRFILDCSRGGAWGAPALQTRQSGQCCPPQSPPIDIHRQRPPATLGTHHARHPWPGCGVSRADCSTWATCILWQQPVS